MFLHEVQEELPLCDTVEAGQGRLLEEDQGTVAHIQVVLLLVNALSIVRDLLDELRQ